MPNVYYPGMSINNGHDDEKNSAQECQHLCHQTDDCNVFTWDSKRKWCWLKSGISSSIELEGAISGPKICGMSNILEFLTFLVKGNIIMVLYFQYIYRLIKNDINNLQRIIFRDIRSFASQYIAILT